MATTPQSTQQPLAKTTPATEAMNKQAREMQEQKDREQKERAARVKEEYGEREKGNNPATRGQRQYAGDAPGMHPLNQPDPDSKLRKGTRLDLEDVTGNPGHRGVNPDAPAGSINKATNPQTGRLESTNEPPGVEPGTKEAPSTANTIAKDPRAAIGTTNEPGVPAGLSYAPKDEKNGDNDDDDDDDADDKLPSHAELERMTRAELDDLAQERKVDVSDANNKQDVIDALQKDARKRKRERKQQQQA